VTAVALCIVVGQVLVLMLRHHDRGPGVHDAAPGVVKLSLDDH
jgi:hypothetical protein